MLNGFSYRWHTRGIAQEAVLAVVVWTWGFFHRVEIASLNDNRLVLLTHLVHSFQILKVRNFAELLFFFALVPVKFLLPVIIVPCFEEDFVIKLRRKMIFGAPYLESPKVTTKVFKRADPYHRVARMSHSKPSNRILFRAETFCFPDKIASNAHRKVIQYVRPAAQRI